MQYAGRYSKLFGTVTFDRSFQPLPWGVCEGGAVRAASPAR